VELQDRFAGRAVGPVRGGVPVRVATGQPP